MKRFNLIINLLNEIKFIEKKEILDFNTLLENYTVRNIGIDLQDFTNDDFHNLLEYISKQFTLTQNKKHIEVFFDFFNYVTSEKSYVILFNLTQELTKQYPQFSSIILEFQHFIINKYFLFNNIYKENEFFDIMVELKHILPEKPSNNKEEYDKFINYFNINRVFEKDDFYAFNTFFDNNFRIAEVFTGYLETQDQKYFDEFKLLINTSGLANQHYIIARMLYKTIRWLYQTDCYYSEEYKKEIISQCINIVKPLMLKYFDEIDSRFKFNSFRLVSLVNIVYTLEILLNRDAENINVLVEDLIDKNNFLLEKKLHSSSMVTFNRGIKNIVEIENILLYFDHFNDHVKYTQIDEYHKHLNMFTSYMSFYFDNGDNIFHLYKNKNINFQILEAGTVYSMMSVFNLKKLSYHGKELQKVSQDFIKQVWEILNFESSEYEQSLGFKYIVDKL